MHFSSPPFVLQAQRISYYFVTSPLAGERLWLSHGAPYLTGIGTPRHTMPHHGIPWHTTAYMAHHATSRHTTAHVVAADTAVTRQRAVVTVQYTATVRCLLHDTYRAHSTATCVPSAAFDKLCCCSDRGRGGRFTLQLYIICFIFKIMLHKPCRKC